MTRFTNYTTISGRKLQVNSNQSKRHFTIKTESGTFRTHEMNQEEFESNEMNTGNDWNDFLKTDEYFKVN